LAGDHRLAPHCAMTFISPAWRFMVLV